MAVTEKVRRFQSIVDDTDAPATGTDGETTKTLTYHYASQAAEFASAQGTTEITIVPYTALPANIVNGFIMIAATQAANASSSDYQLFYDDGAGGTPVALSADYDGTATAVTQEVRNAFVISAALQRVLIPAGSRIYVNSTGNGTRPVAKVWFGVLLKHV